MSPDVAAPFAKLSVDFVGSFPEPTHPLDPVLPEVAFLGRSNVGKSSLLNALVGRRIAKISATPGKTQLLNAFRLPDFYMIDLPGYGFALASHGDRLKFRQLLQGVVEQRERIEGIIWLLDIRHPPSAEDMGMRDILSAGRTPTIVVLTKADKLSRVQQVKAARERAAELEYPPDDLLVTSSEKKAGIPELGERIRVLVAGFGAQGSGLGEATTHNG
ncbi:MAG: ribosome biogenesis GTP-binding protein YihA/YsxC [Gemmatimonadota bacterium]